MGADGLHVVVRGVDAEAGVGGEPVEAVAGLQVHDAVLLEVVHQRLHRFGAGAAVPVVQVHVDLQAVHAALTRRRPQQILPEGGIGAVAGGGVVDAEDEARRAVHQHAVLVVVGHVHAGAHAGRHAGHAIGRIRVRRGVARQVHQRERHQVGLAHLQGGAVELGRQVGRRREVLRGDDLAGRLVLHRAGDLVAPEVTAGRRHADVELHRRRTLGEHHAPVVRVEHEDVDGLGQLLFELDVVEPGGPGAARVVLELDEHGLVLDDDDVLHLDERPVHRPGDEVARMPQVDGRPLVQGQPHTVRAVAEALRLDPGRQLVNALLESDRLGHRRRSGSAPVAERPRVFRQLIGRPAGARAPVGRHAAAERLEAAVLQLVGTKRHRRQCGEPTTTDERGLGCCRGHGAECDQNRSQDPCDPPLHAHPHG